MQKLLDKMMRAGWVSRHQLSRQDGGKQRGGIRWTGEGIARLQVIAV